MGIQSTCIAVIPAFRRWKVIGMGVFMDMWSMWFNHQDLCPVVVMMDISICTAVLDGVLDGVRGLDVGQLLDL